VRLLGYLSRHDPYPFEALANYRSVAGHLKMSGRTRAVVEVTLKTITGEVMIVPGLKHLPIPEWLREEGFEIVSEKLLWLSRRASAGEGYVGL
jgi:hypothetical protein